MSRQQRIEHILTDSFSPFYIKIIDESSSHSVPKGSESHFKCIIVSDAFENMTRVQRHRMVNDKLSQEFKDGLHALSLKLFTNSEWQNSNHAITPSPACRGGSRHD